MKSHKPQTAIILVSEITKGMKSIGSKSLLNIDNGLTALDHQIQYLKKYYHPIKIILCTGFDHHRIVNHTKKYKNIEYYYYTDYLTDNQTGCLLSCLKNYNPTDTIVLTNGLILFDKIKIDHTSATYFIDDNKDKKHYFEIGTNSMSEDGYLFYDLPYKWIELLFLNAESIQQLLNKYKNISSISKLFLFEFINKSRSDFDVNFTKLDKQICYPIKINSIKDLPYAKKQYKKYKLVSTE